MQLTDSGQTVTDSQAYDAWGQVLERTGTTENPFEWIGALGYYKDQVTGMYYVRARSYRASIGRWLSPDPLLFIDGPNLYVAYFAPNTSDPTGTVIRDFALRNQKACRGVKEQSLRLQN